MYVCNVCQFVFYPRQQVMTCKNKIHCYTVHYVFLFPLSSNRDYNQSSRICLRSQRRNLFSIELNIGIKIFCTDIEIKIRTTSTLSQPISVNQGVKKGVLLVLFYIIFIFVTSYKPVSYTHLSK